MLPVTALHVKPGFLSVCMSVFSLVPKIPSYQTHLVIFPLLMIDLLHCVVMQGSWHQQEIHFGHLHSGFALKKKMTSELCMLYGPPHDLLAHSTQDSELSQMSDAVLS